MIALALPFLGLSPMMSARYKYAGCWKSGIVSHKNFNSHEKDNYHFVWGQCNVCMVYGEDVIDIASAPTSISFG